MTHNNVKQTKKYIFKKNTNFCPNAFRLTFFLFLVTRTGLYNICISAKNRIRIKIGLKFTIKRGKGG